jgi:membrane protein required for colicin V production
MAIDVMFLILAGFGFWKGFEEGIIKSLFSFLSIFIGLMCAFKFSPAMTKFLEVAFENTNPLMFGLGFILAFFVSMWLVRFVAAAITDVMEVAHVNIMNKFLGGALLCGIFTILFSTLVWFGDKVQMIPEETKAQSLTYRTLEPLPEKTKDALVWLTPSIKQFWKDCSDALDKIQKTSAHKTETKSTIYDIKEDKKPE